MRVYGYQAFFQDPHDLYFYYNNRSFGCFPIELFRLIYYEGHIFKK